jgi:hypothetical protein
MEDVKPIEGSMADIIAAAAGLVNVYLGDVISFESCNRTS